MINYKPQFNHSCKKSVISGNLQEDVREGVKKHLIVADMFVNGGGGLTSCPQPTIFLREKDAERKNMYFDDKFAKYNYLGLFAS